MAKKSVLLSLAVMGAMSIRAEQPVKFVDHSSDGGLVEANVRALVGGSYLSNNYASCFPEIRQINTTMGVAYGVGAGVTLSLRDYLGLGAEFNITVNRNSMNVFTSSEDVTRASNLYMSNSYTYVNIPFFVSWRFNVASTVRWGLDTGVYYSYGIGGHQNQMLYRALVNDLGQMVYQIVGFRPSFFRNADTFQNSYRRSDIGLHLSSSLVFNRHFLIGVRTQVGFRNLAYVPNGIKTPNVHNISFMVHVGWVF